MSRKLFSARSKGNKKVPWCNDHAGMDPKCIRGFPEQKASHLRGQGLLLPSQFRNIPPTAIRSFEQRSRIKTQGPPTTRVGRLQTQTKRRHTRARTHTHTHKQTSGSVQWDANHRQTCANANKCRQTRANRLFGNPKHCQALKAFAKQAFGCGNPWPERADVHDPKGIQKFSQ